MMHAAVESEAMMMAVGLLTGDIGMNAHKIPMNTT